MGEKMASSNPNPPKVFISYSHDSSDHMARVLELSDRFREDGIDCHLDQYEMFPTIGWPQWTWEQIEWAQFVLIVCTEEYAKRLMRGQEPGAGLGSKWEGAIITQNLYDAALHNTKFVPIVFSLDDVKHIPVILRGFNYYQPAIQQGYDGLYRLLTNQPAVGKPGLGKVRVLPSLEHKPAVSLIEQSEESDDMESTENTVGAGEGDETHSQGNGGDRRQTTSGRKSWPTWFRDILLLPLVVALLGGGGLVTLYKECGPVRAKTEASADGPLNMIYNSADKSIEFNFTMTLKNNGNDDDQFEPNAMLENSNLLSQIHLNSIPFGSSDIKFSESDKTFPSLVVEKGKTRVVSCSLRQRLGPSLERVLTTEGRLTLSINLVSKKGRDIPPLKFCFDSGKREGTETFDPPPTSCP